MCTMADERKPVSYSEAEADFFVSPSGSDSYSGRAPEAGKGEGDGPFRSLARAKQAVSESIASGTEDDIVVMLRSGTNYLSESLLFGAADSPGRSGRVTYCAYPGEAPRIVCGQRVDGFEVFDGEVIRAKVEGPPAVGLLWNGSRLRNARMPKEGYYISAGAEGSAGQIGHYRGEFPEFDYRYAKARYWMAENWWDYTREIIFADPYSRRIAVSGEDSAIPEGTRYYVEGALEFLSQPGEYFMDQDTGWLYIYPPSKPGEDDVVEVLYSSGLIVIEGESAEQRVRGISFSGLTFDGCGGAQISLRYADDIGVYGCGVRNSGGDGVSISAGSSDNTVADSLIEESGGHGVHIEDQSTYPQRNRISNNIIQGCGRFVGGSAGVYIVGGSENRVDQNTVRDMPRYGISMKGPQSSDNRIEYNDLSDCNKDSQDTGVIESWWSVRNSIRFNRIHHTSGPFGLSFGIYLDDESNDMKVIGNVLHDITTNPLVTYSAAIYCKGYSNEIRGNVLLDNQTCKALVIHEFVEGDLTRKALVTENVFCNSGDEICHFRNHTVDDENFADWLGDALKESRGNLVYNRTERYRVTGLCRNRRYEDVSSQFGRRLIEGTVVKDIGLSIADSGELVASDTKTLSDMAIKLPDLRLMGVQSTNPFARD